MANNYYDDDMEYFDDYSTDFNYNDLDNLDDPNGGGKKGKFGSFLRNSFGSVKHGAVRLAQNLLPDAYDTFVGYGDVARNLADDFGTEKDKALTKIKKFTSNFDLNDSITKGLNKTKNNWKQGKFISDPNAFDLNAMEDDDYYEDGDSSAESQDEGPKDLNYKSDFKASNLNFSNKKKLRGSGKSKSANQLQGGQLEIAAMGVQSSEMTRDLLAQQTIISQSNFNVIKKYLDNIASNMYTMVNVGSTNLKAFLEFGKKLLPLVGGNLKASTEILKYQSAANGHLIKAANNSFAEDLSAGAIFGNGVDSYGLTNRLKSNMKMVFENSMVGQLMSMGTMMSGMSSMTGKKGLGGMMSMMDPFSMMFESMLSGKNKTGFYNLNQKMKSIPQMLNSKFIGMQNEGGVKGIIGELLGLRDFSRGLGMSDSGNSRDLSAMANFDKRTWVTINETVPAYMSKILAAISGGPETYYDPKTFKIKTLKSFEAQQTAMFRNNMISDFETSNVLSSMTAKMMKDKNIANNQNISKSDIQKGISDLVRGIAETGQGFQPSRMKEDFYFTNITRYISGSLDKKKAILGIFATQYARLNPNERGDIDGSISNINYNIQDYMKRMREDSIQSGLGHVAAGTSLNDENAYFENNIKVYDEKLKEARRKLTNAQKSGASQIEITGLQGQVNYFLRLKAGFQQQKMFSGANGELEKVGGGVDGFENFTDSKKASFQDPMMKIVEILSSGIPVYNMGSMPKELQKSYLENIKYISEKNVKYINEAFKDQNALDEMINQSNEVAMMQGSQSRMLRETDGVMSGIGKALGLHNVLGKGMNAVSANLSKIFGYGYVNDIDYNKQTGFNSNTLGIDISSNKGAYKAGKSGIKERKKRDEYVDVDGLGEFDSKTGARLGNLGKGIKNSFRDMSSNIVEKEKGISYYHIKTTTLSSSYGMFFTLVSTNEDPFRLINILTKKSYGFTSDIEWMFGEKRNNTPQIHRFKGIYISEELMKQTPMDSYVALCIQKIQNYNESIKKENPELVIPIINKLLELPKLLSFNNKNINFKSLENSILANSNTSSDSKDYLFKNENSDSSLDLTPSKGSSNYLEQLRDSLFSVERHLTGKNVYKGSDVKILSSSGGEIGTNEKVSGISSGDTKGKDDKTVKTTGNGLLKVDISTTNADIDFSKININTKRGMSDAISAELKLLHDIRTNTTLLTTLPMLTNMMYLRLPEKLKDKIRMMKDINMQNVSERVTGFMKNSFKNVKNILNSVGKGTKNLVETGLSVGKDVGGSLIQTGKNGVEYASGKVKEFANAAGEKLSELGDKSKEWFKNGKESLKKWKNENVDPHLAKLAKEFGGIAFVEKMKRSELMKLVNKIKGYSYKDMAEMTVSDLRKIIIDYYNDNVKSIGERVKDGANSVKDFVSGRFSDLKNLGSDVYSSIKSGLQSGLEKLGNVGSGIVSKITGIKIGTSASNEPITFDIPNDANAAYTIGMKQLQLLNDIRHNTGFLGILPNMLMSLVLALPAGIAHLGAKAFGALAGLPKHVIEGLKKMGPVLKSAGGFLKDTAIGAGKMIGKGARFGMDMLGRGVDFGIDMAGRGVDIAGRAIKGGIGVAGKALGATGRGIGAAAGYAGKVIKNKGIWHNFDIDPELFKMAKEAGGPEFIQALKKKDLDSILSVTHSLTKKELKGYLIQEKRDLLLEYYNKYIKNKGMIKRVLKTVGGFVGENVADGAKFLFNVVKTRGIWHNFEIDPQLFKMAKEAGGSIFIEKLKKDQLVSIIMITHKMDEKEAKGYKVAELKELLRDYYNAHIKNKGKIGRVAKAAAGLAIKGAQKAFGLVKKVLSGGKGLLGKAFRGGKKLLGNVVEAGGEAIGAVMDFLQNMSGIHFGGQYAKDTLDQLIAIRTILEGQFGKVDMSKISKSTSNMRDTSGTTNGIKMGEHGFREGSRKDKIQDAIADRNREIQEETLALLYAIADNTSRTGDMLEKNSKRRGGDTNQTSGGGGIANTAIGLGVAAAGKKIKDKIANSKLGKLVGRVKGGVKNGAKAVGGKASDIAKTGLSKAGEGLKSGAKGISTKIGGFLKSIPELITKLLNAGPIKSALSKAGAKNAGASIGKMIGGFFKKFATHPKVVSLMARIAASFGATASVVFAPGALVMKIAEATIGFGNGMLNANKFWGVGSTTKLSFSMKAAAAIVGTLDGVLYGALSIISAIMGKDLGMFIEPIYTLLGGDTSSLSSERSWNETRSKTIYGIDDVEAFTSFDNAILKGNWTKMLKFKDSKGYKHWKSQRYEPLKSMENNMMEDYGGEKICASINTQDPEKQKMFRDAFTSAALAYVKNNNLAWVKSGIGEDDIDKNDPKNPKNKDDKKKDDGGKPLASTMAVTAVTAGVAEKVNFDKSKPTVNKKGQSNSSQVSTEASKDASAKIKSGLTTSDSSTQGTGGGGILKSILTVIKTGFDKLMKIKAIVSKVGKKTIDNLLKKITSAIAKLKEDKAFQDYLKSVLTKLGVATIGGPIGPMLAMGWLLIEAGMDFGKALVNPKKVINVNNPTTGQRVIAGLISAANTLFCDLLMVIGNKLGGNGLEYWYILLKGKLNSFGSSNSGDDIGQWGLIRAVKIYGVESEEMLQKFEKSFFKFGMKKFLKFKDNEAYEYWKDNRYEPLRKIERNIINKYGGEKVCYNPKTCDPDMANKYRTEFLKEASDYIKKHKIEWLRSGISKKDIEKGKSKELNSDAEGNIPEDGMGPNPDAGTPKAPDPNGSGSTEYGSEVAGATGAPKNSGDLNGKPIQGLQVKQFAPIMKGFVSSLKNMFNDKNKTPTNNKPSSPTPTTNKDTKAPQSGDKGNLGRRMNGSDSSSLDEKIIGGEKLHAYNKKGHSRNGKVDALHEKLDRDIIAEIDYLSQIATNTGNTTTAIISMGQEIVSLLGRIAVSLERNPVTPDNQIARRIAGGVPR